MLRSWLKPIFETVPRDIRLSGMFPMALYAAINPMSTFKSPYYGIVTFAIVWLWFWHNNVWGTIRNQGETWEDNKWAWILRTTIWAFFTQWMLLFVVYVLVLLLVKVSVFRFRLNP